MSKTKKDEIKVVEELRDVVHLVLVDEQKHHSLVKYNGEFVSISSKIVELEEFFQTYKAEKEKEIDNYVKTCDEISSNVTALRNRLEQKEKELKLEIHKSSTYFQEKLKCMKKLEQKEKEIKEFKDIIKDIPEMVWEIKQLDEKFKQKEKEIKRLNDYIKLCKDVKIHKKLEKYIFDLKQQLQQKEKEIFDLKNNKIRNSDAIKYYQKEIRELKNGNRIYLFKNY